MSLNVLVFRFVLFFFKIDILKPHIFMKIHQKTDKCNVIWIKKSYVRSFIFIEIVADIFSFNINISRKIQ